MVTEADMISGEEVSMKYWIVQSNPLKFPIIEVIREAFGNRLPQSYQRMGVWHVKRIPETMRAGDIVFVWKSDGGVRDTRGIYAKAKVFSVWPHRSKMRTADGIDALLEREWRDKKWIDSEARAKNRKYPTIIVQYTRNLIEAPLKANEIKKVPELKSVLILRFFQRTLYGLTEDQGRILDKMTGGSGTGPTTRETKSESPKIDHDHLKDMLYEIGQTKGRIAEKDLFATVERR